MEIVLKASLGKACLKEREGMFGTMGQNTKVSLLLVFEMGREPSQLLTDSYTKESFWMKDHKVCVRFTCRTETPITVTSRKAEKMAGELYFLKILKNCLTVIGKTITSSNLFRLDEFLMLFISLFSGDN